jgi:hypothetical protein
MSTTLALIIALASGPAPAPAPSEPPAATPSEPAPAATPSEPAPAATPSEPAAAPSEPAPASPPPPSTASPADAGPPPESSAGKALLATGIAVTVSGGVALLFIALPSAIVKRVALNRARRDPVVGASSREARYNRARIADDVMEGAFWTGIACLAVGLPLTIAGAVIRQRAKPDVASRVELDATGATIRF